MQARFRRLRPDEGCQRRHVARRYPASSSAVLHAIAERWADAKDKTHKARWAYQTEQRKSKPNKDRLDRLHAVYMRARNAEIAAARVTCKRMLQYWGRL